MIVLNSFITTLYNASFHKSIITLYNASFHKSPKVREAIENVGCRLIYLPTYSPDFNPIEHYWRKIKSKVRRLLDSGIDLKNAVSEFCVSSC